MNTTIMLSNIEKLLPPTQRREWALTVHEVEEFGKELEFDVFLEYLLREKDMMEYIHQSVRHPETSRKDANLFTGIDEAKEKFIDDGGVINTLQRQMKENQIASKRVADGLVLGSRAVLSGESSTNGAAQVKKKCLFHSVDTLNALILSNLIAKLSLKMQRKEEHAFAV